MTYFNDTLEQEESNITSNISLCNFHTYDLDKLLLRSGIDITLFDKTMEALPVVSSNGPWLGGGALRRLLSGTDIFGSDFDFFFASGFFLFASIMARILSSLTIWRMTSCWPKVNIVDRK